MIQGYIFKNVFDLWVQKCFQKNKLQNQSVHMVISCFLKTLSCDQFWLLCEELITNSNCALQRCGHLFIISTNLPDYILMQYYILIG